MKLIKLASFFCLLNVTLSRSCSENINESNKKNESDKAIVIKRFSDNRASFSDLSYFFKLNHIIGISFMNDSLIKMSFTKENLSNKTHIEEITVADNSDKALHVLGMDSISQSDWKRLKLDLAKINCKNFELISNYDVVRGRNTKEILLTLPKFNDELPIYYYRIYQEPLDSAAVDPNFLINNNKTGGKLDNHVIWYFKWKL